MSVLFDVLHFSLGLFAKDERKKYLQLHYSSRQDFLCITGKLKSASICCEMQASFQFCFGRIIQLTLKADSFDRFLSFHDNWIPYYTALLYRKIFIPLNLYIRQILSYLKQNESYLFETIFGLLLLSISLSRRSVVQKCQLSLCLLPWTVLALNGFSHS